MSYLCLYNDLGRSLRYAVSTGTIKRGSKWEAAGKKATELVKQRIREGKAPPRPSIQVQPIKKPPKPAPKPAPTPAPAPTIQIQPVKHEDPPPLPAPKQGTKSTLPLVLAGGAVLAAALFS